MHRRSRRRSISINFRDFLKYLGHFSLRSILESLEVIMGIADIGYLPWNTGLSAIKQHNWLGKGRSQNHSTSCHSSLTWQLLSGVYSCISCKIIDFCWYLEPIHTCLGAKVSQRKPANVATSDFMEHICKLVFLRLHYRREKNVQCALQMDINWVENISKHIYLIISLAYGLQEVTR